MRSLFMTCALAGGLASAALAQDTRLVDCPTATLYGAGCRPAVSAPVETPQVPASVPLRFPREIMAPDTPPLFVDLVNDLTPENADRFLDWQEELLATIQQVKQLLHERIQVRQQQGRR